MSAIFKYENLENAHTEYDPETDPKLPETKFQDGSGTDTDPVPASGLNAVQSLVINIAQGTSRASQRIGQRIMVKKIIVRLTNWLTPYTNTPGWPTTVPAPQDSIRWILVLDTQCNGTACSLGQVLSVPNIKGFRNLDNSRRFVILYDRTEQANPIFDGNFPVFIWETQIEVKDLNIPITYSTAAGTMSSIRSNNFVLFGVSRDGKIKVKNIVYRVVYNDF